MEGKLGKVLTTIQPKIFVKEGSTRASEVSGQKPTLSLCGIDLSQRQRPMPPAWSAIFVRPEGRAARLPVIGSGFASFRGARFPHYQKFARVKPPLTSIIRTAARARNFAPVALRESTSLLVSSPLRSI